MVWAAFFDPPYVNGQKKIGGMKAMEEIQEKALLAFISFIPAFPLTRFYLSTY